MLFRIHINLRLYIVIVVLLLQRMPSLPAALLSRLSLPTVQIVQKAFITAAGLAAPHALSGATTSEYRVEDSVYKVANQSILHIENAKVGTKLTVDISNTVTAASWSIQGALPPGLIATDSFNEQQLANGVVNTPFLVIKGTPASPGQYALILQPWSLKDGNGDTAPRQLDLVFDIAPGNPAPLQPPSLGYERDKQTITLRWSTSEADSYQLKRSTNLSQWEAVVLTPEQSGGQSSIQFPLTQTEFYRFEPAP